MGGKKKPTLTQLARQLARQAQKEAKRAKREKKVTSGETKTAAVRVIPPDPRDQNVIKQLQSMKVITPYTVASRFNILLSVAKDFLEELHRQGVITYVSGGRSLKIYKPSGQ